MWTTASTWAAWRSGRGASRARSARARCRWPRSRRACEGEDPAGPPGGGHEARDRRSAREHDEPRGRGGHRDGGRTRGHPRRRQDGHGRGRREPRVHAAVVHLLRARRRSAHGRGGYGRAHIRPGRHRRGADREVGARGTARRGRRMTEVAGNALVDGRYRVLRRIGSGGMADVYCAEDTHLGRQVALKVLHRRFAQDQEFVERFRREAKSAAGLNHPNVVGVFDRGEHEGTYYIAMEFLTGRTLKDIASAEAPLPQERVIDIGTQILEAAGFAHRHGVIHRDFKPHNVIVDELGHAKVTDFGIARAGASEMTETGSIMGTAQYLSPEQAQGHAVTATSDIYSIGVMLYEMLAGRLPFEGDSAVAIALKHLSEPPAPISQWRPDVHPALEAVVMAALAKDPSQRWQSAEDLAAGLEAARTQIEAGPNGGQDTAAFAAIPAPAAEEAAPT